MFGKLSPSSDKDLTEDPELPDPVSSTSNPNPDHRQDQRQTHLYFDQNPLNLGSQSSQRASTLTSAHNSSTGNDSDHLNTLSSLLYKHGQKDNENDDDDRISAYSYRSDIDADRFLREVEGRIFSALNESYFFPSDENEWARLAKQHIQMILGFDGLYPAKETVDAILAPHATEQKRILDLGTGSGIWAIDMAKKFPHAEVIGIDIVPVPIEPDSLPPNCGFELDDVQLGLTHFHHPSKQFDVIHARFISPGLQDFFKSFRDAQMCLKPGGIIIWIAVDAEGFTSKNYDTLPYGSDEYPNGSWTGRIWYEAMRAGSRVGPSDFEGVAKALDEGFWNERLMDPATCRTGSLYVPAGPWASHEDSFLSQRVKYIGALMRQNLREINTSLQFVLRKANWPIETINEWQKKAEEELSSMNPPTLVRYRVAWGRRRNDNEQQLQAPSLPFFPLPSASSIQVSDEDQGDVPEGSYIEERDPFSSSLPYPFFFVYETREQALAEDAARKRSRENFVIPPLPP